MNSLHLYRRVLDGFDAVLAAVSARQWEAPSMCSEWSVRDVAGHVIWGQEQLRHWACGTEYGNDAGAPGAPHPAELAGADPLATWRDARERSFATLDEQTLAGLLKLTGLGEIPLAGMVSVLTSDTLVHTWDIGHALGMPVRLDPELVTRAFEWAHATPLTRAPAFFAAELTPPEDSDELTRLLAYLGRAAWQPVPA